MYLGCITQSSSLGGERENEKEKKKKKEIALKHNQC